MVIMIYQYIILIFITKVLAADDLETSNSLSFQNAGSYGVEQYLRELKRQEPTRQGPVLFPSNGFKSPRGPLIVTSRPLLESIARSELSSNNSITDQRIQSQNQIGFLQKYLSRGKDYRPYVLVPDYLRGQLLQRVENRNAYEDYEEQPTLPPIYKALSDYARGNLAKQQKKKKSYDYQDKDEDYKTNSLNDYTDEGKNYAFAYAVRDRDTGDDFSHKQRSVGSNTNGEYRVRLPDGRMQIVSYTADENGYKAEVRYDNEKEIGNTVENKQYNVESNRVYSNNEYTSYQNSFINNGERVVNIGNHKAGHVPSNNAYQTENNVQTPIYQNNPVNRLVYSVQNNEIKYPESKPIVEDHYNEYTDLSKEYNDDYSLEFGKDYGYEPYKSKFVQFAPKNKGSHYAFVPKNRVKYPIISSVRPSYQELKPLFVPKKYQEAQAQTINSYRYNKVPFKLTVPSTTQNPNSIEEATTEHVVIIGTTKSNLYTNIRHSLPPNSVTTQLVYTTPITPIGSTPNSFNQTPYNYITDSNLASSPSLLATSNNVITTPNSFVSTTPRSFLFSTISNLQKNVDLSGKKPVLSNSFIDRINKYLSFT